MPTIVEVANRAGVSPITVSRVVNDSGPVSSKVRARVEQAIAETGYVPNAVARSLRSKRTDTIALVVTDMTNPFFTTIAHGVEAAVGDSGMMLIICSTDERQAKEERYVRMLLQRRVDGILLVPAGSGAAAMRLCHEQGTPLVVVDRRLPGGGADAVRADSRAGAYELGRLLVSLGHRTMAVLTGPREVPTADDRAAGFRQAVAAAGGLRTPRVHRGAFSIESGREMARLALAATPRPTALFAANNFIAIGVLHALDEMRSASGGRRRGRLRRPAAGDGDLPLPHGGIPAGLRDGAAERRHAPRAPLRQPCSRAAVRRGRASHAARRQALQRRSAGRRPTVTHQER
jgi:LacI family transcriptional regulator